MKLGQLLVIADRDMEEQCALYRALDIAQQSGASLHVVAFIYDPICESDHFISEKQAEEVKQSILHNKQDWLDAIIDNIKTDEISITSQVVWSEHVHKWIISHVESTPYDMVIKTAHKTKRLLYTPTDWHLLRECPAPLYLVTDVKWPKKANVLAAIDVGSDDSTNQALNHSVVEAANCLAKHYAAKLNLAYMVPISTFVKDLDLIDVEAYETEAIKRFTPKLLALGKPVGVTQDEAHVRAGMPEKIIPKLSNKLKCELVVMGTVGRKGLKAAIIGNTAEKVLSQIHCDVLALKPQ